MTLSEELRLVALELIAEEGRNVAFEKVSQVPEDIDNPHRGTVNRTVTVSQKAAFTDFSVDETSRDRTLENQKKLLTAHEENDLSGFDFVVDGNARWKIKNIKTVSPGTQKIMYEMRIEL